MNGCDLPTKRKRKEQNNRKSYSLNRHWTFVIINFYVFLRDGVRAFNLIDKMGPF